MKRPDDRVKPREDRVLALGTAGLWILVLCIVFGAFGYVQHSDQQDEAAAEAAGPRVLVAQ